MANERDKFGRWLGKYTGEKLVEEASKYFETVEPKRWTINGLSLALGITKKTFYAYLDSEDKELQDAADWCATRIGDKLEFDVSNRPNPTGSIFLLKQKPYGFKDNQDVEIKGNGTFNIISNIPRPKEK